MTNPTSTIVIKPGMPSDVYKLGPSRIYTDSNQTDAAPDERFNGHDVSSWHSVQTIFYCNPDDANITDVKLKVIPWRYYNSATAVVSPFATFGAVDTVTKRGQWIADRTKEITLDPATSELEMFIICRTLNCDAMFFQVVEYDGAGDVDWFAQCVYGVTPRDSEGRVPSVVGDAGAASGSINAVHDEPVVESGPQIMFDARSAQATAVDAGDAARPIVNLYGEQVIAGYDWNTASISVTEADPLNEKVVIDEIVNDTAVDSADSGSAPSADGIPMLGFKDISFQLYLVGGVDAGANNETVTVIFKATDDLSDGAAVRWPDVTPAGYDLTTNTTGNASYTATGAAAVDYVVDFDEFNMKRIRADWAWGGAPDATDGEIVIRARRKAL